MNTPNQLTAYSDNYVDNGFIYIFVKAVVGYANWITSSYLKTHLTSRTPQTEHSPYKRDVIYNTLVH